MIDLLIAWSFWLLLRWPLIQVLRAPTLGDAAAHPVCSKGCQTQYLKSYIRGLFKAGARF